MSLYLAYESSLGLLRYLRSVDGELMGTVIRKRTLRDAITSQSGLDGLDTTATFWLKHTGDMTHAFVGERSKNTQTKQFKTHVWSGQLPVGSYLDIGHDVCLCTPEFLFVQMATKLDLIDLIALGCELCGGYSKWHLPPAKMDLSVQREYEEEREYTFDLGTVTTVEAIERFITRNPGMRGSVAAQRALSWVFDRAASPMESGTALLLSLPRRLGGYGLPRPILNPKINVRGPSGLSERYPDLFWEKQAIDVEYQSDLGHSGSWNRYRDSKREVELTVGKVTVLPLTRPQVMDVHEFDEFAHGLRMLLGTRRRKTDSSWEFKRAELRAKLLPGR